MIRLRLSRRLVHAGGIVACVVLFLTACYFLGDRLTPRDGAGRPLILSPSVQAAERYRRSALRWVGEMAEVDRHLSDLLVQEESADPSRLYRLGREAEELVERATNVARDATLTSPPPALLGLAEQVRAAAEAHRSAALKVAQWVGAPEPDARRAALEALRLARGLRTVVEANVWLNGR